MKMFPKEALTLALVGGVLRALNCAWIKGGPTFLRAIKNTWNPSFSRALHLMICERISWDIALRCAARSMCIFMAPRRWQAILAKDDTCREVSSYVFI